MSNSEKFLATFSNVEKWLVQKANLGRHCGFISLLNNVKEKDAVVRRFLDDLRQFAELRNVIVHNRRGGKIIAEPNDEVVAEFIRIYQSLTTPPKVMPCFAIKVEVKSVNDSIADALKTMRLGDFSQLPILADGKVIAVLTSKTVVRWLASELENDVVSLLDTTIQTVLTHLEDRDHYAFLSSRSTLYEVIALFDDFSKRGKELDAVLITASGKANSDLKGILTVFDFPLILQELHRYEPNSVGAEK